MSESSHDGAQDSSHHLDAQQVTQDGVQDSIQDTVNEDVSGAEHSSLSPANSAHDAPTYPGGGGLSKSLHPENALSKAYARAIARGEVGAEEETSGIEITYLSATDVGLVREQNEDNFLAADLSTTDKIIEEIPTPKTVKVTPKGLIFGVCDGMGGAAAGEVASQMAVEIIERTIREAKCEGDRHLFARALAESIRQAGLEIFKTAQENPRQHGMGTTATVAGLLDAHLFVGQVGDSRAYLLREDTLTAITKDQSLVTQLLEAGQLTEEEAQSFEHSNIVLQALGTSDTVYVDLTTVELRRGDRLLLCSDGVSGLIHNDLIQDVLAHTPQATEAWARIKDLVYAAGAHDNLTGIIVDFRGADLQPASADAKVTYTPYMMPRNSASADRTGSRGDDTQNVRHRNHSHQRFDSQDGFGEPDSNPPYVRPITDSRPPKVPNKSAKPFAILCVVALAIGALAWLLHR